MHEYYSYRSGFVFLGIALALGVFGRCVIGGVVDLYSRYNKFMERSSDYILAARAIFWLTYWITLIVFILYGVGILLGYEVSR